MKTSEQCVKSAQSEQQRHHNDFIDVFIVNFEQIFYIVLLLLFLTLNKWMRAG